MLNMPLNSRCEHRPVSLSPAGWSLAVLLLLFSSASWPVEVSGLLDARVPVQDQSERSRLRGIRDAMKQVLIKQTGSNGVLDNPGVQQALSLAPRYVTEYGYTTIAGVGEDHGDSLALTASFSENAINRLLRREQLPVWPANRMKMLIWLLRDDPEFGKQHITTELMPRAYRALELALARRGVPAIKPVLDLQDRLTLNPRDAWNFNQQQFEAAATRYRAELWLALRVYRSGDGSWRGSVWASAEGKVMFENLAADDIVMLVNQAVDRVVDSYSLHYTYVPQLQTEELLITIANIRSYAAYRQVSDYLQNLELVQYLKLDGISNDQLKLRLALNGQADLLYQTLQRDARFEVVENGPLHRSDTSVQDPLLPLSDYHFRWVAK